jgi:hypothetical protein
MKERSRIKRLEEKRRNMNEIVCMKVSDAQSRNENVLEEMNHFSSMKEEGLCSLSMSIPFLHSQHLHKSDSSGQTVSSDNTPISSSSGSSSSSSGRTNNLKNNINISINNKSNANTTCEQKEKDLVRQLTAGPCMQGPDLRLF